MLCFWFISVLVCYDQFINYYDINSGHTFDNSKIRMSANIIVEHNETGLVKSEAWCQDGKQYRVEKEYYCNGQLSQESHYRNEVKT